MRPRGCDRGQASVELLGAVPAVLLLGVVLFQLLAVGYAATLAGSAAEAGALALAAGADPVAGVREAIPRWSRVRARTSVSRGRVKVTLRTPSPLQAISRRLEVSGEASVVRP